MVTNVLGAVRAVLWIVSLLALAAGANAAPASGHGSYARVEIVFQLPGLAGNPFDFTENDVAAAVAGPDGKEHRFAAFFDGGDTWRVRFTPEQPGRYTLRAVTRNGQAVRPQGLSRRQWDVAGAPSHGFVRRGANGFVFDDGTPFYPVGQNVGWASRGLEVADVLAKMGAAGENWARIWMCHWDRKNLDWVQRKEIAPGQLDLDVARRWDGIVAAAEKAGVYVQMTLQHHGQYSSRTDPNWRDNPWNKARGGWLETPEAFFTDEKAQALTRAKFRYIVARWGYSSHIMAWEIFNEVQWTDAMAQRQYDAVAAWHSAMAAFLRAQDPQHHLVTTSSILEVAPLWRDMDYLQPHSYPSDAVAAVTAMDRQPPEKPFFFGEVGPGGNLMGDDGSFLHRALWAGLMSRSAGAAQYWTWEVIDRRDLYPQLGAGARFAAASGMAGRKLAPLSVGMQTDAHGALTFGPGGDWGDAKQTEFTVSATGEVRGIGAMPAYLQGNAHREMFPQATFLTTYPAAGTFAVSIRQVARSGARLVIEVDGQQAAEKEFAAAGGDTNVDETVTVPVPAGNHAVALRNTGADWLVIRQIALSPYVPALAALGKGDERFAVAWIYARPGAAVPLKGTLTVPGLGAGRYRVTWYDTMTGRPDGGPAELWTTGGLLPLQTPAIEKDAAVVCERIGAR